MTLDNELTWSGPFSRNMLFWKPRTYVNREAGNILIWWTCPLIISWLSEFTLDLDLLRPRVKPDLRNNIDSFVREIRV
jgi:hypothetical protein